MNNLHWTKISTQSKWLKKSQRNVLSHTIQCVCGKKRDIRNSEWIKLLEGNITARTKTQCKECTVKMYWEGFTDKDNLKGLFKSLKNSCKRIKRDIDISFEQAYKMYKSNCYYCNSEPSNTFTNTTNKEKQTKYSGIDRVDSDLGYIQGNVVPCCKHCNIAKNNMSQTDFLNLVENIFRYRVQRLSSTEE